MKVHGLLMHRIGVLILALACGVAFSQVRYAEESFEYEVGSLAGKGTESNGWAGPWSAVNGAINVVEGALGFDSKGGHAEAVNDAGPFVELFRDLSETWPDDGSTYWIGFMFQRIDTRPARQYGGLSLYIDETEILFLGSPFEASKMGYDLMGHLIESTEVPDTELSWLVAKLVMGGDEDFDSVYFWVNPDHSTEPSTSTAALRGTFLGSMGFNKIRLATTAYLFKIDMIRLGTSFDVIRPSDVSPRRKSVTAPSSSMHLGWNRTNSSQPVQFQYSLEQAGNVSLIITDIAGRTVAVPVAGYRERGTHNVGWMPMNLPGGMYVGKLRAGNKVISKKLYLSN